jgi:hypothetical protein
MSEGDLIVHYFDVFHPGIGPEIYPLFDEGLFQLFINFCILDR